jgi:formate/nitrite transporter FocA (FNT family)
MLIYACHEPMVVLVVEFKVVRMVERMAMMMAVTLINLSGALPVQLTIVVYRASHIEISLIGVSSAKISTTMPGAMSRTISCRCWPLQ